MARCITPRTGRCPSHCKPPTQNNCLRQHSGASIIDLCQHNNTTAVLRFAQVNIGWKSFVIDQAESVEGCLDEWEGTTDIGSPFGDGVYRKKSVGARLENSGVRRSMVSRREGIFRAYLAGIWI